MAERVWIVYMLECADGTLYTGITTDLSRRLEAHASGKGARYTRGRGPYRTLLSEPCATKSGALKRELEIKALSRESKLILAASYKA